MFDKLLTKVHSSSLISSLLLLTSGSLLAQIIGVLAAPLLSRLYTPEQFGVLGTILAVSLVISSVGSLKYEMAIVLEKNDAKAHALQRLCLSILFLITAASAAVVLSVSLWPVDVENNTGFARYLPWVIPIAFFIGLFNILNYSATRAKAYKAISLALIGRRLSTVFIQLSLGLLGAKALGLIVGNMLGCVVAVAIIFVLERSFFTTKHEAMSLKKSAETHYRFAYYTAPQSLLNMLSNQLPVFMLGYFYGADVAGAYFFAMRILHLPAALVGQAIRQVFYREATDLVDHIPELRWLYLKTSGALAAIIIIPVIALFIWGPPLFAFVFGDIWRQAGDYSRWMFLWVGMGFINPPSTVLYNVLNMQRCAFILDGLLFLLRLIALLCGGLFFADALNTVIVYSFVGLVINIVLIMIIILRLNRLSEVAHKRPSSQGELP